MPNGQLGPAAPSAFTEEILPAFNGHIDIRVANRWSHDAILNFLCSVAFSPVHFGVPPEHSAELADIFREIRDLSAPAGAEYWSSDARLGPPHHILREFNPKWDLQDNRNISKFKIRKYVHNGISYWSPIDLLGLFISVANSAPNGATKRNHYLPLAAMYGKWCNQLLATKHRPSMYSCLWVPGTGEFFLGASLGGCIYNTQLLGSWPLPVKRARYSLVGGEPVDLSGWSFSRRPEANYPIGNCAETYPLVYMLRGLDRRNKDVHGLALRKGSLKAIDYQDTLSGSFWTQVRSPCENCEFLIELHGGNLENFEPSAGSAGAPP